MKVEEWIPRLFLVGAALGALGSVGRADYNLPVFLFAFVVWHYLPNQQLNAMILFAFSLLVDFIWLVAVGRATWGSKAYKALAPWETGVHKMVVGVVLAGLVVKVASVSLSYFFNKQARDSVQGILNLPNAFK